MDSAPFIDGHYAISQVFTLRLGGANLQTLNRAACLHHLLGCLATCTVLDMFAILFLQEGDQNGSGAI